MGARPSAAARRRAVAVEAPGRVPSSRAVVVPPGFEALGEALVSRTSAVTAAVEVGRATAREGASLGEALEGLRAAYLRCRRGEPEFEVTRALCVAWAEATLEFLHDVGCEDPLTGLASVPHLRTRLAEVYRAAEAAGTPFSVSHALVVVELGVTDGWPLAGPLRMAHVAQALRAADPSVDTVARVRADRAAGVVRRGPQLGARLAALRSHLGDALAGPVPVRIWVEGLPAEASQTGHLLDELGR